jgi:hypothetical protein
MGEIMDYVFPEINDGDVVSFDTETNGVDWRVCHIVGFVITLPDRNFNCYYPIRHETGNNLNPNKIIEWVKSWSGKKLTLIGHNLKFDLHMCANDGIFFPNSTFEDTQINANLIDEHMGNYSLDNVAKWAKVPVQKGTGIYAYLAQKFGIPNDKKSMSHFWKLDAEDPVAHDYAMADGEVTYLVRQVQQEIIDFQGLRRVWKMENDKGQRGRMNKRTIQTTESVLKSKHYCKQCFALTTDLPTPPFVLAFAQRRGHS